MESGNYNLICDIDHPVFDLVDNDTRRKILRLIACEHNYGNRIASILDLSTPAIHRHLKYLSGNNPSEISLIDMYSTTNLSHSGHKGGEAQLYRIKSKIGMFYHIFPNFVHSHIFEDPEVAEQVLEDERDVEDLDYIIPQEAEVELSDKELSKIHDQLEALEDESDDIKLQVTNEIGDQKLFAVFRHYYERIQIQNRKIREMEEDLLTLMGLKNDFMGIMDTILQSKPDLGYEERVILRAITCLGKQCSSDLSHLMNLNPFMINQYVQNLREKNWVE